MDRERRRRRRMRRAKGADQSDRVSVHRWSEEKSKGSKISDCWEWSNHTDNSKTLCLATNRPLTKSREEASRFLYFSFSSRRSSVLGVHTAHSLSKHSKHANIEVRDEEAREEAVPNRIQVKKEKRKKERNKGTSKKKKKKKSECEHMFFLTLLSLSQHYKRLYLANRQCYFDFV